MVHRFPEELSIIPGKLFIISRKNCPLFPDHWSLIILGNAFKCYMSAAEATRYAGERTWLTDLNKSFVICTCFFTTKLVVKTLLVVKEHSRRFTIKSIKSSAEGGDEHPISDQNVTEI